MPKTLMALYDSHDSASAAVEALIAAGFDRNNVGLAARDKETDTTPVRRMDADLSNQEGAALGAVTGGLAGLALGLTAILVPGIGTLLAAGPLTVLLGGVGGAVVGAATGGAVAAFVNIGVPQEQAEQYAESIRRGSSLVTVNLEDESRQAEAENLLRQYGPYNLDKRVTEWKTGGWQGFDAASAPYPIVEREVRVDKEHDTAEHEAVRIYPRQ